MLEVSADRCVLQDTIAIYLLCPNGHTSSHFSLLTSHVPVA